MKDDEFDSVLELKIETIISLLMDASKMEFEDAVFYLYSSRLYSSLIDESTKLWHLSAEKLVDILDEEKKTNTLTFPDFV